MSEWRGIHKLVVVSIAWLSKSQGSLVHSTLIACSGHQFLRKSFSPPCRVTAKDFGITLQSRADHVVAHCMVGDYEFSPESCQKYIISDTE